jgi:hypothetical protein
LLCYPPHKKCAVIAVDIELDKVSEFRDHPGLTLIQQDIRQPGWGLEELVRDAGLVIDLIAYANPGPFVRMPLEVFRLNFSACTAVKSEYLSSIPG